MPKFKIEVRQDFRVTRWIVVERDAQSLEAALHEQSESDAPDFTDPRWNDTWTLTNEEVLPALGSPQTDFASNGETPSSR